MLSSVRAEGRLRDESGLLLDVLPVGIDVFDDHEAFVHVLDAVDRLEYSVDGRQR